MANKIIISTGRLNLAYQIIDTNFGKGNQVFDSAPCVCRELFQEVFPNATILFIPA